MGLYVYKVQYVDTHGGSIRVYVKRNNENIDKSVDEFIKNEEEFGLTKYSTYQEFSNKIHNIKSNIRKNIDKLKLEYACIAGYGSPAKATTALNFFGINNDDIEYIIEDNDLKNGKFVPCVNIPIKDKKYCAEKLPDLVIVLAWNFFDSIVENNKNLINQGIKFMNITELQK